MVATATQLTSDQEQLDYLDTVFAKQRKAFNVYAVQTSCP